MRFMLRSFRSLEDGYIFVLSLILMPVFLSISLMFIDLARVNNAHGDLQTIADAAALAGARELDRSPSAIINARLAMAEVTNTVSMLDVAGEGVHQSLTYQADNGHEISVVFLDAVPVQDTTLIDTAWLQAHAVPEDEAENAVYVYVHVRSDDFDPLAIFPSPNGGWNWVRKGEIPVGAIAVARSVQSACNVPPLYICNPFEFEGTEYREEGFQEQFRLGDFHGRMIKLHPKGSNTDSPGNFGFLQVPGANDNTSSSIDAIRDIFAGRRNPTCYDAEQVTTKTGAATSVRQGINVKFDLLFGGTTGPYSNWDNSPQNGGGPNDFDIIPAVNVRKGYESGANACNASLYEGPVDTATDPAFLGFPDDNVMSTPGQPPDGTTVSGALIGDGDWDLDAYLENNYQLTSGQVSTVRNAIIDWGQQIDPSTGRTNSAFPNLPPSRYDVYRAELEVNHPNGGLLYQYDNGYESGGAICAASKPANRDIVPTSDPDPRVTFAAIVDCETHNPIQGGGVNDYPVNSFVTMFLTRPMESNGSTDSTIDVEITDVTGSAGSGALDDFVRIESILIR